MLLIFLLNRAEILLNQMIFIWAGSEIGLNFFAYADLKNNAVQSQFKPEKNRVQFHLAVYLSKKVIPKSSPEMSREGKLNGHAKTLTWFNKKKLIHKIWWTWILNFYYIKK